MAKWDDFVKSKEYKLWGNLKEVCNTLGLRSENDVLKVEDLNDYWEPLLERLFKMGVFFKQTAKLKEIKIDWMRPIFYIKTEYVFVMDGKKYEPPTECMANGQELHRSFRYLVAAIQDHDKLEPFTFKKMKTQFQKTCGDFFKSLIKFATKMGFRHLNANVKEILRPLLDLRKANYHLFLIEAKEQYDVDLTLFKDRKDLKEFVKKIQEHFQSEEYKMKRDVPDMEKFQEYMYHKIGQGNFEFVYNDKKREENLWQLDADKFRIDALQKKFEQGFDKMLKYLYEKQRDDFFFPIDVHKLFRNIDLLGGNQLQCVKYYMDFQKQFLREMKIKLFEMKINGLTRIKMPITQNVDLIEIIKKLYDIHNVVDNLMGDKLKFDQFGFFYHCFKFVYESTAKDELTTIKNRGFMEDAIPKYVILQAMRQASVILEKMRLKSKSKGLKFVWDDYYQVEKMPLDTENDIVINAFEINDAMKRIYNSNPEIKNIVEQLEVEMREFEGRFWIMEGFFPIEDRKLWLEGIEILRNINNLVIDDIRDYILLNYEDPLGKTGTNMGQHSDRRHSKLNESTASKKRESRVKMPQMSQHRQSNKNRMSSARGRKGSVNKNDKSYESDEESILLQRQKIPAKLDNFRPPYVWNYPVEILVNLRKKDQEDKKNEIRNVDPTKFYKDGRVKNFLDILTKIKTNMMEYCMEKKSDCWKFNFEKLIAIWNINYTHSDKRTYRTMKKNDSQSLLNENFNNI